MASVFSSIPMPKGGWRTKRFLGFSSPNSNEPHSQFSDEQNPLPPQPAAEEPNLRELNASLQALTDIFPDIQPEVFREMLSSFDEESRLQVVTENLLKHKAKWIRGRYRVRSEHDPQPRYKYKTNIPGSVSDRAAHTAALPLEDTFRSEGYKTAVKEAFYQEFKGLSRSTIRAVLAEHNYSYAHSRPVLIDLVSKSWRYSLTSLWTRRKAPSANNHPLVSWRTTRSSGGAVVPTLKYTASSELNEELLDTLIRPVIAKIKVEQELRDRALADQLNDQEAEEFEATYDCECCFTPSTFEHLSTCDDHGHYICFRCIRHSINEALYGQGWARYIGPARTTIRCIAPTTDGERDCRGCIPVELVHRALCEEPDGQATWRKLEERAASETLIKSQAPLIRCPFCVYAEIDDMELAARHRKWRTKNTPLLALIGLLSLQLLYTNLFRTVFRYTVLFTFIFTALNYLRRTPYPLFNPLQRSLNRLARKRRGLKFTCLSPSCGRSSCLNCHKEWRDIHTCFESELLSLRNAIETATAEAVKRTCPACNLSFVKASGCNKLTCVCGYHMCYVCRQEIGKESYGHFCQHFRPDPGKKCVECEKCDLYRTEDEDVAIRKAAERAEREWMFKEGKGAEWEVKGVSALELGHGGGEKGLWSWSLKFLRNGDWEGFLDGVVGTLVA